MKKRFFGFTIIELLIVLAIIGLFATISVTILNGARVRSRDAKRVSDVQVIRAALEQFWLKQAAYPLHSESIKLGSGNANVLTAKGFEETASEEIYLMNVPTDPKKNYGYYYFSDSPSAGYALQFQTEGDTDFGPAGLYYAHSDGIDSDPTVK